MTAADLMNIFLRLQMAQKDDTTDLMFDAGRGASSPFAITGIHLDEDGDICLESDARESRVMTASEIAEAVAELDDSSTGQSKTIYFVTIDESGESQLYNIKDGGTYDRHDPELKLLPVEALRDALQSFVETDIQNDSCCSEMRTDRLLHLESGTISFTINSIYMDEDGCLCLESNEIDELADYTVGLILEELAACPIGTRVYLYDDQAQEYYGIYASESYVGSDGDIWIKAR